MQWIALSRNKKKNCALLSLVIAHKRIQAFEKPHTDKWDTDKHW